MIILQYLITMLLAGTTLWISPGYVLSDQRVTSVLIGTSSVSQLDDNLQALKNTRFTTDEFLKIEDILK